MFQHSSFAPLPHSFMAVGIIGFLITVVYRELLGTSWTFTLGLFFLILFLASFISVHYGPLPDKENY